MRALQTAHEAAANSVYARVVGAGVLPTRHPAKLNGDGRRADAYYSPALKLERPDAAEIPTPPARPRSPLRGRRASDRGSMSFPHPSQLKPQTPFMAQLMVQDQVPGAAAVRTERPRLGETAPSAGQGGGSLVAMFSETSLVDAQRRHVEQVGAYRKTVTMATDFIVRRYHLATDIQGLMITDDRAVEMMV